MPSMKTPVAENVDGSERQVKLGSTRARAGNKDRDILVVLVISVVLAVAALLGALAFFSGSIDGFGGQARSPTNFENASTATAPVQPAP